MSAKWRALQHRHRYTYSAVVFPPSYSSSLPTNPNPSSPFFTDLAHLTTLTSLHSQLPHAKNLAASFTKSLNDDQPLSLLKTTCRLYLQILFLENSHPLHRTLISSLCKVNNKDHQALIGACFRELCQGQNGYKRFCLSRVVLSVMGMPKLGYLLDVVEDCAVLVAWDAVLGLEGVVSEVEEYARPSPIVMEQCQESLSCLYYLLQRFPVKFSDDGSVMERALGVLVSVLKSTAFSRDCFVAAGVSLFAALQVCLTGDELGLVIIRGIFNIPVCSDSEFSDAVLKVPFKGDFCSEISSFEVLSRLSLIRGILTAVSRTVLNTHFAVLSGNGLVGGEVNGGRGGGSVKTILYDGILPEICNYCENPVDGHFNFHALTVMQICLQQIKTSILGNVTDLSGVYEPMPVEMGTRILRNIWNNLEDPLSQTVKQVHLVFDLLLDIQSTLHWGEGGERIKSFLRKIASDLLRLGPRCKGRYVPLALLTKRLGAKTVLDMSPNLLFETVQAYIDDDVCCAATSFLKSFLEYLRDECWNSDGIEKGYAVYRQHCLPPFLYGLASGVSKLRSNLNTYALPVLLEVDEDSIFPMLAFISVGPNGEDSEVSFPKVVYRNMELGVEQQVAVLVSLLKVCRALALIEGDVDLCPTSATLQPKGFVATETTNLHALLCIKGIKVRVVVEWLVLSLTHADELLRVDAAESLFLNPKTASLPSHLELTLLKKAVPLNMRSCSTGFQMKWTSLFRKFFSRVRTALERQFKLGSWQPLVNQSNIELSTNGVEEAAVQRSEDLFSFMRWLSGFLFCSCYPSAPYKRKIMAMELILIMLNVWSIVPHSEDNAGSVSLESCLNPYSKGVTSPDSTLLLVGSIVDSWDRLRENSFRILLHFPNPLPGITSKDTVEKLIIWAKNLVSSPRVRESDAGALTFRLIFRKYVVELGWIIRASTDVQCSVSKHELVDGNSEVILPRPPVVEYIKSLINWLTIAVGDGERDLSEACKNSFVHGVLLTLRYTFEELDWNSDAVMSSISDMKHALEALLKLIMRITSLALWVVSADAWYLPDIDEMVDDDSYLMDEINPARSSEDEGDNSKHVQDSRASEQIVMVGCWLAMKEVSLLLGTIIRKIPLPCISSCSGSSESVALSTDAADAMTLTIAEPVLDLKQLELIGNHFLEVLLKMKHNGAIDKTRAGFTALCNRLLCSNEPRLCKLTESWMEQVMDRTVAEGQVVDDLLRRSAGIPAAFIALFLSEPDGAPKKLLPRALRWLIDLASRSLLDPTDVKSRQASSSKFSSTKSEEEPDSAHQFPVDVIEKTSKIRDEGVVPTVHAFNVLRAAFNDTNLATDTSGFAAEALIVSIRSFSSPYWEVRNGACLAYTALVRRMLGFLNVQKRESARRALTGLEFFHRYPLLHPFIYNELKVATDSLVADTSGHFESKLAKVVHPSLCPMLILLSRLKPSTIASESGDDLDPFLFMPFIKRCSSQSNLRIRVLASRALTGLVSNEKLPTVLLNIASELPSLDIQTTDALFSSTLLNQTSGSRNVSYNSIHGMLLQLCSLLDANCRNLADFSKKEKILSDLVQVLAKRSWIANPRVCPCPILNTLFVRVLDHMLSISRTGHDRETFSTVRYLLLELSTECLDLEDSCIRSYYDPTIAELCEQATISYFSCVLYPSEEVAEEVLEIPQPYLPPNTELLKQPEADNESPGLQERLIRSLSDPSYEVRLATLKWLLKLIKSTEFSSGLPSYEIGVIQEWAKSNLQETLNKLLDSEKNHRCRYHMLRILYTWNLLQFHKHDAEKSADILYIGTLDFDSMLLFWDKLLSLYKLTRHLKTREMLICCMAICVKQFAGLLTTNALASVGKTTRNTSESYQLETSAHAYECVAFFVNLIKQHSDSSEQVSTRKAAAESIISSSLLEHAEIIGSSVLSHKLSSKTVGSLSEPGASNRYAHQVLDIWFTCIKLLEDEDDGIRQRLAMDVQKCFSSKRNGNGFGAEGVPTQVEKVIELSFQYLSSIFGHWIDYFEYLSQWVLEAGNCAVSKGDLVRRVFDKEIDNHHEEKLLICQICCHHLEQLPISKSWPANAPNRHEFMTFVYDWRMRFHNQLTAFAKDHVESLEGVDWIGGVGNHKDAFLPLYANLLGFYALSNCLFNGGIQDGVALLSDVHSLGKTIEPYFSNPLVSNLYLLVVKTHELKIGVSTDQLICKQADNSDWEGFDPYFLLR
ncbi:hypothetical protein Tsubulata_009751 [Turnera subulata]|uniref:DUF2428 domain-containing protein n=1 Tax=Turnera subulata TaxID=218843 RepID=A0A9Q0J142_9ROSI|nr:hypothetical protein Tsubulata_009751 [Turnera subulata]